MPRGGWDKHDSKDQNVYKIIYIYVNRKFIQNIKIKKLIIEVD